MADPELLEDTLLEIARAVSKNLVMNYAKAAADFHQEIDHPETNIDDRIE